MLRDWRKRYPYSVSKTEIETFVDSSQMVKTFLGKYEEGGWSWRKRARALCMFFKWLRLVRQLEFTPEDFLKCLAEKRISIEGRTWGRDLVLAFTRDNKDITRNGGSHKYGWLFISVKVFCDFNEVPLTTAKGLFRFKNKRVHAEPPHTIDDAKRVLGALSQRDRAVSMTMLQSGQGVGQALGDMNEQGERVIREVKAGAKRIKFEFDGRKGTEQPYFTYISADAIQEIAKWLPERQQILDKYGIKECKWLFITEKGEQLTPAQFGINFRERLKRHKVWTGPYSVRPHMFRQIFGQEASPPDRGISRDYITFMRGHTSNTPRGGNRLDDPGNVYDKQPFIDPAVVEGEYAKLEPFINIYSGGQGNGEIQDLKVQIEQMREQLDVMAKIVMEETAKNEGRTVLHKV